MNPLTHHCRENMGLDLPDRRGFMRLLSADGVPVKRIQVDVKW